MSLLCYLKRSILEYSSFTAAANNATVVSNKEVEDYLPAFLEPPECGWSLSVTKKVVGGESAELGKRYHYIYFKCRKGMLFVSALLGILNCA